MKDKIRVYLDKILSILPVAVFVFTIVFFVNIFQIVEDLNSEFGTKALDEFVRIYTFYLSRTIILALLIPFFDVILSSDKLSYKLSIVIHFILINSAVLLLFYQSNAPSISVIIIIILCSSIYITLRVIIYYREKSFVNHANNFFKENKRPI